MTERPILFSGPMVRAILEGRKTQTRRVVKVQPEEGESIEGPAIYHPTVIRAGFEEPGEPVFGIWSKFGEWGCKCPYGQPGDRLWVRESFRLIQGAGVMPDEIQFKDGALHLLPDDLYSDDPVYGRLIEWTGAHPKAFKPSIHMPRWASRITLEIVSVRVERLNEITEADAQWEGCERLELSPPFIEMNGQRMPVHPMTSEYRVSFEALWESINGPGSWSANPWVWVVEFRPLPTAHR